MQPKIKISLFIVGGICLFLFFSSPNKLVVDELGNIKGITNKAREIVQGKKFWRRQGLKADEDLKWYLEQPKREAKSEAEWNALVRELKEEDEKLYREYPEMRPSKAEQLAEELREKADRIEEEEHKKEDEKWRKKEIAKLHVIIGVITNKINQY